MVFWLVGTELVAGDVFTLVSFVTTVVGAYT